MSDLDPRMMQNPIYRQIMLALMQMQQQQQPGQAQPPLVNPPMPPAPTNAIQGNIDGTPHSFPPPGGGPPPAYIMGGRRG